MEEIYTCDKCREEYEYELPICPGCGNDAFDVENFSGCCNSKINDLGLCIECKEHCI